jgi:type IV secretory pathway VirB2 component (pilin)
MIGFQKAAVLFSIFFLFLLGANLAYAIGFEGPIVPCGTESNPENCTLCHLWELISNIINFITLNLALPVAAVLFIVAGIIFIVAGDNEEKINLAKTIFKNTVIGLVIIFCSWLLVDTLVKTIAGNLQKIIGAWNDFPKCD